jgi:hypothetical protein
LVTRFNQVKAENCGWLKNSLFGNLGHFDIETGYFTMESIPVTLFEDNLEHLVQLGYIRIHPDENMKLMLTLSPERKQWVEDNGELIRKTEPVVFVAHSIISF